ncbi:hypothetical protein [Dyadobacter aurulentus]|uniref:hypothetical protein n=1 Tax=Dyadobacter sp. UC 10 TaxID=2605428 RepID=UPI0011F31FEF|nr:hypothetical protein [Dyadobacter sp. UC 10]KAA0993485.1 hypothetical protein FXO21_26555 [Dyadobacter sp. UC 10]
MTENSYYKSIIFGLAAWLLSIPCSGQKKYEREFSIKSNAVPQKALDFVSAVFEKPKVHWYGEESLTGNSVEAKLKYSGRRYSIEFDESGNVQDVEILSGMKQMRAEGQMKLKENLGKTFSRYKIVKTQIHWKGTESALKESIRGNEAATGVLTRYEFILKGSRDKKESYFEVLAEEDGGIVSVMEVVQRNTDNLVY